MTNPNTSLQEWKDYYEIAEQEHAKKEREKKNMAKIRTHNEWFRDVSLNNRKSCPTCGMKKAGQLYSWGEYVNVKWRTVKHFCQHCFETEVKKPLLDHAGPCGCLIELQWRGYGSQPEWLSLSNEEASCGLPTK